MEELTKVVTELHAYGLKQHTIVKMVKDIFASVDNAEVKISPKSDKERENDRERISELSNENE